MYVYLYKNKELQKLKKLNTLNYTLDKSLTGRPTECMGLTILWNCIIVIECS